MLALLGLALVTTGAIGWQGWNGWGRSEPRPVKPDMKPTQWDKFCDWLKQMPLLQPEPVRPLCWPVVLSIEEDAQMADTFRVKLGFAGDVPQPDPNDPNADRDTIVARRVECSITPLAGGETVVTANDYPIGDALVVIAGVAENSKVRIGAAYVNDDGQQSAEFTYLPEFDVIDTTGPVNLSEDVTVEVEEES